jgi:hypothetical protein
MNIPDKINIVGHEVVIERHEFLLDTDGTPVMGLAFLLQDKIKLATTCATTPLSPDNMGMTLLHEIVHHISDKFDIKLTEKQVTVLSSGLYGVLKDNDLTFGKDI